MASSNCVVVLCPNGRRQTVKVTPNTSILQVLEDACRKQGLNPEDYDIRHFNRKLDLSLSIRFSNVPNNAMLELYPASSKRQEVPVTIGLQLETGQRILNDFQPSSTLWDVVTTGNEVLPNDNEDPVCIYMRREIVGKANLETTSLRSLGLTSGKAIIRLIYRQKGTVCQQAHVSSPLTRSELIIDNWNPEDAASMTEDQSKTSNRWTEPGASVSAHLPAQNTTMMESNAESRDKSEKTDVPEVDEPNSKQVHSEEPPMPEDEPQQKWTVENEAYNDAREYAGSPESQEMEVDQKPVHYWGSGRRLNDDSIDANSATAEMEIAETAKGNGTNFEVNKDEDVSEVHYLGERDALLFNLDDIPKAKLEELPDEFYELTLDDALYLLADLKRRRRELEERPLETSLARLTKQVVRERHYKRTIIRIQFPSRHVLQACFSPSETGATLKTFVQGFLDNPSQDFYLFTTPPKTLLNDNQTLFEMNLVPAAVVYFGANNIMPNGVILRKGLESKVTKAEAVFRAASLARKSIQKESSLMSPPEESEKNPVSTTITTSQIPQNESFSTSNSSMQTGGKVPKWFKFGK